VGDSREIELPGPLREWVGGLGVGEIVSARRHLAGASRDAFRIDISRSASEAEAQRLFLMCDKGSGGGSARDAAVLRALAETPIPVPPVVGQDEGLGALLLEYMPGRSDFPSVDHASEREPTARHLMELTATLHGLEPASLEIPHLSIPASLAESAREPLARAREVVSGLGPNVDPFFRFALGWLERNVPPGESRCSLVHSDMGPGNFLFQVGRVTAVVDWEVAHFGDPMEDLAAIAVRDMATPVGHLPTRFAEYEAAAGVDIDLTRVGYYRALVLVRNSLMIGLGLAHPVEGFDVAEMTMYQTLLMRAAALVICDCMGVERPRLEAPRGTGSLDPLLAAAQLDLESVVIPALPSGLAAQRAGGVDRVLATRAHADRVGPGLDRAEIEDLASVLEERPATLPDGELRLHALFEERDHGVEDDGRRWASYFARRLLRLGERRRPLMAHLMDRLPQPLEEA